jgi:hypothetical protein
LIWNKGEYIQAAGKARENNNYTVSKFGVGNEYDGNEFELNVSVLFRKIRFLLLFIFKFHLIICAQVFFFFMKKDVTP